MKEEDERGNVYGAPADSQAGQDNTKSDQFSDIRLDRPNDDEYRADDKALRPNACLCLFPPVRAGPAPV